MVNHVAVGLSGAGRGSVKWSRQTLNIFAGFEFYPSTSRDTVCTLRVPVDICSLCPHYRLTGAYANSRRNLGSCRSVICPRPAMASNNRAKISQGERNPKTPHKNEKTGK